MTAPGRLSLNQATVQHLGLADLRKELQIVLVESIDEVLRAALTDLDQRARVDPVPASAT